VTLEIVGSDSDSFVPAIKALFLSCGGDLGLTVRGLDWFHVGFAISGLKSCGPALRSVRLQFNRCELVDMDYARLLDALATHETLESFRLYLDGTDGGLWACARSLKELLVRNRTLKRLELESVPTAAASKAIVRSAIEGLRYNSTLRELRIALKDERRPHELPDGLLKLLLIVLRERNFVLRTFGGSGALFPSDHIVGQSTHAVAVAKEIQILLKQNRYGRRSVQMMTGTADGREQQSGTLPPPPLPADGIWPILLGNVAAESSAVDVMYRFVKVRVSFAESAPATLALSSPS
jgi:hypothetical protein